MRKRSLDRTPSPGFVVQGAPVKDGRAQLGRATWQYRHAWYRLATAVAVPLIMGVGRVGAADHESYHGGGLVWYQYGVAVCSPPELCTCSLGTSRRLLRTVLCTCTLAVCSLRSAADVSMSVMLWGLL
eukprot:jgi/Ulvmu1/11370/UM075_0032.1